MKVLLKNVTNSSLAILNRFKGGLDAKSVSIKPNAFFECDGYDLKQMGVTSIVELCRGGRLEVSFDGVVQSYEDLAKFLGVDLPKKKKKEK